jgi:hypothetical protein
MAPLRPQDLPAANKIFVDREEPQRIFDEAVRSISRKRTKLVVFYGAGGQGKTRLREELLCKIQAQPTQYGFLRYAAVDLTGQRSIDPDRLLVWIRNEFAKAGVFFHCFDLAFLLYWKNLRGDEPPPKLDHGWLGRHVDDTSGTAIDSLSFAKSAAGDALSGFPFLGTLIKSLGGYVIKKGYEKYLLATREPLQRLLNPYGKWKPPYEISALLPEMLAEDLKFHVASCSREERLVLFIDEYEGVFPEGGTGRIVAPNPADQRIRDLATQAGGYS